MAEGKKGSAHSFETLETESPTARADKVVTEFERVMPLDGPAKNKLKDLVAKAVDERFEEMRDIRLGRVLGSALAAL